MSQSFIPVEGARRQQLLSETDQCVSCGMCLPHCPTYQVTGLESESPRGRLSIVRAIVDGQLSPSLSARTSLDHCLLCRSCENVCPAGVPYSHIMDEFRTMVPIRTGMARWRKRALMSVMTHPRLMQWASRLSASRLLGRLRRPMLKLMGLQSSQPMVERLSPRQSTQSYYPATAPQRHDILLFTGCVHSYLQHDSVKDAIAVLNRIGIGVFLPRSSHCCGAMHLHDGEAGQADRQQLEIIKEARQLGVGHVVLMDSACTVTLQEALREQAEMPVVTDLCSYLEAMHWHEHVALHKLEKTILLYTPCTQRNAYRDPEITLRLLSRIPGLDIQQPASRISCCGAAGLYMLDYPDMSDKITENAMKIISITSHDYLVTTNIGCVLKLSGQQSNDGANVIYPVQLLSMALQEQYPDE